MVPPPQAYFEPINWHRTALHELGHATGHPLDQFRAFLALREKGQSEEEIATAFFVAVSVVKQRLRLASVSPRLLDVYAEDEMTLDQLMAFTVNDNHERQEQVFTRISQSYAREPHVIRRVLTEGAVLRFGTDKIDLEIEVGIETEVGGKGDVKFRFLVMDASLDADGKTTFSKLKR
jgi:ParB-like chromosome segregation protein Spo0J